MKTQKAKGALSANSELCAITIGMQNNMETDVIKTYLRGHADLLTGDVG